MLIALAGRAGIGKSTALETLKANSEGRPVVLTKFAAPLYSFQESAYRMILPVYTRPETFVKDRPLLQLAGDWAKSVAGDDVFVRMWTERVKAITARDPEAIHVNDDTRYNFEADAIHAMGGVVVKITTTRDLGDIGGVPGHHSENGVSDSHVDYVIENNGTLEEFQEKLKALFVKIKQDLGEVSAPSN